jgi:hypothetical protein
MKQQLNSSPSKANSMFKDLNNSEEEEISNTEFQKNNSKNDYELKEETHKVLSELKKDMNK